MSDSSEARVAIVTGASRGIGREIARVLAANGHQVIGTATSESGASGIDSMFADEGTSGRGAVLDVNNGEQVNALVKDIASTEGAPLILVNNAGITRDNLLARMSQDEWDDVIATDLTSVYRLSRACLRGMMKARWGRIINITSVVAVMGNAGQSNYAAAKAGMVGFSRSLAREVGSRNITVNAVAPGYIETDMTRGLDEKQRDALVGQIPLRRLGTTADIAEAVRYLASGEAGYVTGTTLHVNGGMSMA